MAEIVAGLWAVEEVISTGVQAGIAGYAVSKPTMPVTASFHKLGSATHTEDPRASLARSHHTLTVAGKKAFIFGGQLRPGELAGNEMHVISLAAGQQGVPDYQALPAIANGEQGPVPSSRTSHSACAVGQNVVVYGGVGQDGKSVDDSSLLWLFDTHELKWQVMKPETHPERIPPSRGQACILSHDNNIVLVGGQDATGTPLQDVWHFNTFTKTWNALPSAPVTPTNATIADNTLYLISTIDHLSSQVHSLDIELYGPQPPSWQSATFPTNPLTPVPSPRRNGGLLPVSTGYGRNFLLYLFGEKTNNHESTSLDDMWTYQLPSSQPEMQTTTDIANAIKPAKIKDQIREKMGVSTGNGTWGKVERKDLEEAGDTLSKTGPSPAPRSCFACATAADQRTVVLWGGLDVNGDVQGDGWIIRLE